MNNNKIILDLCGGSGSWAKPYKEAGYQVYTITLPDFNVLDYYMIAEDIIFKNQTGGDSLVIKVADIYGILAAPPCTMFSLARTRAKTPRDFNQGMATVEACLDMIWYIRKKQKLAFWALENPVGYLRQFLGKPPFTFHPTDFGERYTKRTDLWGYYTLPTKKPVVLTEEEKQLMANNSRKLPSITDITGSNQAAKRAITPAGFAQAFYNANK